MTSSPRQSAWQSTSLAITGGIALGGSVRVAGSKNAFHKLLAGCIAVPGVHHLLRPPTAGDADALLAMVELLGARVQRGPGELLVDTRNLTSASLDATVSEQSTGSFLFAGALLTRFGEADIGPPGGDRLGPRPVDRHLAAFRELGVQTGRHGQQYVMSATQLHGARIHFERDTVNGTTNAVLAAVGALGETVIEHASIDPDVQSLVAFLDQAGVPVATDLASGSVSVVGPFHGEANTHFTVPPDRNDAATLAIAAMLTHGQLELDGITTSALEPLASDLRQTGLVIDDQPGGSMIVQGARWQTGTPLHIRSGPYPGFLTDWGPLVQVVMTQLRGISSFDERVFVSRFDHLSELERMGAQIRVSGSVAHIGGPMRLRGACVAGQNLRGAAALLLAGLIAEGRTTLRGAEHLYRGYDDLIGRLQTLGAQIVSAEWSGALAP